MTDIPYARRQRERIIIAKIPFSDHVERLSQEQEMNNPALVSSGSGVINLDQPGTYLHWSIFTVSVANLALRARFATDR